MITISLCMIVKNEESTLPVCLDSVKDLVDEINIVDTGSTDNTREIARKYTVRVYDFRWVDDFSAARNYAFTRARCDYVMWLDADDILLPADRERFLRLKDELDKELPDVVMLPYVTARDGSGRPTFSYFRERLVKHSRNYIWREPVHEYIDIAGGSVKRSDAAVTHTKHERPQSDRNLKIYRAQLAEGKELSPRASYYFARELKDNGFIAEAAARFEDFLAEGKGWVEDNISAAQELAECYFALNENNKGLNVLFGSFLYDLPRSEICCRLGYYYKAQKDYQKALYWFERALLPMNEERPPRLGFTRPECSGYIPAIECAVCLDALNDPAKAEQYNELAGQYKPGDPSVAYNKEYFASKNRKAES